MNTYLLESEAIVIDLIIVTHQLFFHIVWCVACECMHVCNLIEQFFNLNNLIQLGRIGVI